MSTTTPEGVNAPVEADALAKAIRWHEISGATTTPEEVVRTAEVFAEFLRRDS